MKYNQCECCRPSQDEGRGHPDWGRGWGGQDGSAQHQPDRGQWRGGAALMSSSLHQHRWLERQESLGGFARDIVDSAETLTNNIQKMSKFHGGSVPLASLLYCHYAEFEVIVTVVRSHYCLTIMIFFIPDSRLDQWHDILSSRQQSTFTDQQYSVKWWSMPTTCLFNYEVIG